MSLRASRPGAADGRRGHQCRHFRLDCCGGGPHRRATGVRGRCARLAHRHWHWRPQHKSRLWRGHRLVRDGRVPVFPGTEVTTSGRLLVAYRRASSHDLAIGSTSGVVMLTTSGDGNAWSTHVQVAAISGEDIRDMYLYRAPDERRVYLGFSPQRSSDTQFPGAYLCWSDDDGQTWTTPTHPRRRGGARRVQVAPLRGRGVWRWPVYSFSAGHGTRSEARWITANDPTGA